jgi:hypothetical protein
MISAQPISMEDLNELIKRIDSLEKGYIKFPNYNAGTVIKGNDAHAYECPSDGFIACDAGNCGQVEINGNIVGMMDFPNSNTYFVKKGDIINVTSTNSPVIRFFPFYE